MTPAAVTVRPATREDMIALNRVYNGFVVSSHISFDVDPWTDKARTAWFDERVGSGHITLVAERDGKVLGGAWSGPWRTKAAYERSAETTVMLEPSVYGSGIGEHLYRTLVAAMADSGLHRCYAVIALPNEASIRLHSKLGFTEIGILDEVGFKDGRYISTMLMELRLRDEQ